MIAAASPVGIPGNESFYEHVHFNFDGNYRLAVAWAEEVRRILLREGEQEQITNWCSQAECERRLGLTDWNRYAVLGDMQLRLMQPPFTNQLNHLTRLEEYRKRSAALRTVMDADAAVKARQVYIDALKPSPTDYRLHENFGEFLESRGELGPALDEWVRVRDLLPHHHLGYFQSGRLMAKLAKLEEAKEMLRYSVRLRPDLSEGWLELGKVFNMQGTTTDAVDCYHKAEALLPGDCRPYYLIGKIYSSAGRREEAIAEFRHALQRKQNYWEARYALGEELAVSGKPEEARAQFEEVIRAKPDYVMAHLNLGVALVKLGQLEQAVTQFDTTLKLDPANQQAKNFLEQLQKRKQ